MDGPEEPQAPSSSARILLIEDDPELAAQLASHLRAHGMAVTILTEGGPGLTAARDEPYDAAVVDMLLPGASGFAVVQEVRAARGPHVPVVMTSEIDATEHREYAHLIGVDWFLAKPFSPDDLLSDLQVLLAQRP